ncbi:MAG: ABC transporter ATP-binding protein [Candidatus Puniceispirillaceae bacterium]
MSRAVLELQGLNKSFGALHATRDLSFCVNAGEIHALIGPNGAGKTTLIQQIYGALKPDTGHVLLNGKDITSLPVPGRVRAGIGRSFQISNVLMDFTVLENGIIAEQARLGQSFRFLRPAFNDPDLIAGARKILAPVGLDDRADQRVGDLAHGERRMLELGLALATAPQLLLLDEPMAGAGPEESQRMSQIIETFRGKLAILLIEHDMDAVFRLADRITVLVEGAVIASGTADEISNSAAVQTAYLGSE